MDQTLHPCPAQHNSTHASQSARLLLCVMVEALLAMMTTSKSGLAHLQVNAMSFVQLIWVVAVSNLDAGQQPIREAASASSCGNHAW